MELRESAELFPGCCVLSQSGDGPFIDLGTENVIGERKYVSAQLVRDMAAVLGLVDGRELEEASERILDLEAQLQEARGVQAELEELRASVRKTLNAGAVANRDGTFKLRPVPGQRAVSV